jgi:hypothetical protein
MVVFGWVIPCQYAFLSRSFYAPTPPPIYREGRKDVARPSMGKGHRKGVRAFMVQVCISSVCRHGHDKPR